MKKILRTNFRISENKNDCDIIVIFKKNYPYEFCLSILLLEQELIERLVLLNGKRKLHLIYDQNSNCSVYNLRNDIYEIYLDKDSIGYLMKYLLEYFRDEIASVNHIHIPLYNKIREIDLIIEVERSKKPISGEEAIKLLNEYD